MAGRRKDPDQEILVAIETGEVSAGGETYFIRRNVTRVRAGHPLAKAAPNFFKPIDVHYDVERMTAAPGERRGA